MRALHVQRVAPKRILKYINDSTLKKQITKSGGRRDSLRMRRGEKEKTMSEK